MRNPPKEDFNDKILQKDPHLYLFYYVTTSCGVVKEFVFQLEYNQNGLNHYFLDNADFKQVARFDHKLFRKGHDVRPEKDGLHMDQYFADTDEYRRYPDEDVDIEFPNIKLSHAPTYARTYLIENRLILFRRYVKYHGSGDPWLPYLPSPLNGA